MPEERQKDWTDMVTLEGSPPNADIYFWIHFKARRSFQVYECHDLYKDWATRTHGLGGRDFLSSRS